MWLHVAVVIKECGVKLHLSKGGVSTEIVWSYSAWEIYLLTLFIYLTISFYQYGLMGIYFIL